jgi:ATP-dependent Clp protease ATP-binding subunit ClpA
VSVSTWVSDGVHPDYINHAQRLANQTPMKFSHGLIQIVVSHAPAAARDRDDDHVGTEHLLLGMYREETSAAPDVLIPLGITNDAIRSVLVDEEGSSPEGPIPLTDRSRVTLALAVQAAHESGSTEVEPLHLLLGVVSESRLWESFHTWGPHHLRNAATLVGRSLDEVEQRALAALI